MLTMAPSAKPLNVPVTGSLVPLLSMMMNWSPALTTGVPKVTRLSVAFPRLTVPVTTSLSKLAVLSASTWKVEPLTSDRLPVLSVPGDVPGATVPPLSVVTATVVPVPPSVAPFATVTGLRRKPEPVVKNVPPPSVIVLEPAFRSLSEMLTLSASTRLMLPLPVVVAVTVVAARRRKFVVEPMPFEPASTTTSSAVRSVPELLPVVTAPLPLVVSVTSPPLPAFSENAPKTMSLLLPVVRLTFVFDVRVMSALNVIVPLLLSPICTVPAETASSSPSLRPSWVAESEPPRLIFRLAVRCRSVAVFGVVTAPLLRSILSAINVTLALPVAVTPASRLIP